MASDTLLRGQKTSGPGSLLAMLEESGVRPEVPYPVIVGATIKAMREAMGLLQKDLAERAGLAQAGLSRMESGAAVPDVRHLIAIAKALGTMPGALLGEADQKAARLEEKGISISEGRGSDDPAAKALGTLAAPLLLEAFGGALKMR